MTWVVGRSVIVGYAVGLSDIRVTLCDGSERDCLRKIYPVGRMLALGFAGSVAIGFAMVERLATLLGGAAPGMGWDPTIVADWWPADARLVFEQFPEAERKLHAHLIMLGAHPNQNNGDVPWARCYVYRFMSPDFDVQLAPAEHVVSIGSGSGVSHYIQVLAGLRDSDELLQLEAVVPGGVALGTMDSLTKAIAANPTPGVSTRLHLCLVRRDLIEISANDQRYVGHPELDLIMPAVANSKAELEQLLSQAGLSSAGASC